MDDLTQTLLVGSAGALVIASIGLGAYYRIGGFTLYPWERSRRLWYPFAVLIAGTVVITLLIPILGLLGLLLHLALLTGLVAFVVPHIRRGTRAVQESPEFQAERAKRLAFARTRIGRALLFGPLVAMLAWLVLGVPALLG
jgi:hypothetical protein